MRHVARKSLAHSLLPGGLAGLARGWGSRQSIGSVRSAADADAGHDQSRWGNGIVNLVSAAAGSI